MTASKATQEVLIKQKKDYIKKLLNKLNEVRNSVDRKVQDQEMVSEDYMSQCVKLRQHLLDRNVLIGS